MVRLKYHSLGDIWKVFVAPQNTFPCFLLNCLRKKKKPWLLMKLQLTFPFIPTFKITFVKPTKHCKVDICLFWDRSSSCASANSEPHFLAALGKIQVVNCVMVMYAERWVYYSLFPSPDDVVIQINKVTFGDNVTLGKVYFLSQTELSIWHRHCKTAEYSLSVFKI